MQNNLTEKEINNLYNWAKKYNIKELQTKDINELLNLKELTLENEYSDGKNFSYIPDEIFKLINLESLYIDCYGLEEIPNDIGNLINLKKLTIEGASFEELPNGISNLTKLKTLNFICCSELINLKEFLNEINFSKDFALYFVNKNYKNEIKEAKFENVYKEILLDLLTPRNI